MKNLMKAALVLGAVAVTGACKMPAKYECTITDAKTGVVLKKVKVNSKAECDAIALGVGLK
jgi:hypothetical protein